MPTTEELVAALATRSPAEIDEILAKTKEIALVNEAEAAAKAVWPKRKVLYVHRDKESNYDLQDELGLSDEAMDNFRGAGYEVGLICDIYEDGTSTMVGVEGPDDRLIELNAPVDI